MLRTDYAECTLPYVTIRWGTNEAVKAYKGILDPTCAHSKQTYVPFTPGLRKRKQPYMYMYASYTQSYA